MINLIDTPGHVDFTVEVERSLRVLDGAVLVLCGVGGVQSQSLTVDRQMKRYHVPAWPSSQNGSHGCQPRARRRGRPRKDGCDAVLMQWPIGKEDNFQGVIDLITMKAYYFDGANGERSRRSHSGRLARRRHDRPAADARRFVDVQRRVDGAASVGRERFRGIDPHHRPRRRADADMTPVYMGLPTKTRCAITARRHYPLFAVAP